MALDGKLLAQARKKLDDIRHHNEETQAARQREIYARLPAVRSIDLRMQNQMRELASIALRRDSDAKAALERLEAENLALQARRKELLTAAGYAPNYTDDLYSERGVAQKVSGATRKLVATMELQLQMEYRKAVNAAAAEEAVLA